MMAGQSARSERDALERLAAEYARDGYEVIVEPTREQLPDFLKGFRPDVIVQGQGETIVIEAKRPSIVAPTGQLKALAEEISKHPGWRLQVVIPSSRNKDKDRQFTPPTMKEIRAGIR